MTVSHVLHGKLRVCSILARMQNIKSINQRIHVSGSIQISFASWQNSCFSYSIAIGFGHNIVIRYNIFAKIHAKLSREHFPHPTQTMKIGCQEMLEGSCWARPVKITYLMYSSKSRDLASVYADVNPPQLQQYSLCPNLFDKINSRSGRYADPGP